MVWGWVHNFPASKDTFTKPVDYPTVGWDTMIADWWEDVFNASEAVQEYLIAGVFEDRGDPASADFDIATLTGDAGWYDLDISSIVGARACCVILGLYIRDSVISSFIDFRTKGNTNNFNIAGASTPSAWALGEITVTVFTNSAGKIQYAGWWTENVTGAIVVRMWSPR